jgi:Rad3-related DNA helicase
MARKATLGKLRGKDLRESQEIAIDFITGSDKRFIAVRGPTGVGKTCLGFESTPPPFFYVCSSKQLQDQAVRDYPEAGLLKGRGNYYCKHMGTADLCIKDKPCEYCEYQKAKKDAMACDMTILNFHYFLTIANHTKEFKPRNIIIDEADDLERVLVGFVSFEFTGNQLKKLGVFGDMPSLKTKIDSIIQWIDMRHSMVLRMVEDLEEDVDDIKRRLGQGMNPEQHEINLLRRYKGLKNLLWKLSFLKYENIKDDWIYRYDSDFDKITLKPIWLTRKLIDRFLYRHGDNFLFMSATIPSKEVFCGLYGLEADELDYCDLENLWDSDKRRIFLIPRYNVTYKDMGPDLLGKMREGVKDILGKEKGRGIIHCVSYKLGNEMLSVSKRLMMHTAKDKNSQLDIYKKRDGAVFVSPSSTRGLDLPYDLCEFVIWLKAPFLNTRDPQVSARLNASGKFGNLWYANDAVQSIIQGCGRGFRNPDDYCTVYMLDRQIDRLLTKEQRLWPLWFRELITYDEETDW